MHIRFASVPPIFSIIIFPRLIGNIKVFSFIIFIHSDIFSFGIGLSVFTGTIVPSPAAMILVSVLSGDVNSLIAYALPLLQLLPSTFS